MNKEFAPYEPSLALKELGFDEPCFGYYEPNKEFEYINWETFKDFPYLAKNSEWQDLCAAPTFSQAFRWFREKHNLKSWVQEHTADTFIYEIRPHVLTQYKQGETYVYTNYEEAELACLNKLIEIVKQ
jgi:hypothetical protein